AGQARHPRERRRAGADLDAADPLDVPAGQGGGVRDDDADGPRRAAGRGGELLRVPRVRRLELHRRAVPAPQRRQGGKRL
ncbi:MAG: oxidoreductase, short chain dehydrogenase/reductase family, partial [uncultured Phycisphaerae bacterium]